MVLEATIVCVDNSEWMRNGDFPPSRMESQYDAVNLICNAKTQSNPENTVGIMTMAGRVEVLVSLTTDLGKILTACHQIKISGESNIINSLQVAQLALKNRQNRSQQQRIVLFIGSPLQVNEAKLIQLGKQLKKNNIAIDLINFGEENSEKLDSFIQAVDNKNTSHLLYVPPGPNILSDVVLSSSILYGEGGAGPANEAYGGVDPNIDPELALALQMSREEERQRQEAAARAERATQGGPTEEKPSESSTSAPPPSTGLDTLMSDAMDDEDAELARAIALSLATAKEPQEEEKKNEENSEPMNVSHPEEEDTGDLQFLENVLSSLPGVDPENQQIKELLESMKKQEPKEKDQE